MISVIIPCHNVPLNWVKQCIESVKNQDVDFEIVLISDATEEPLLTNVREYLKSEKVKIIYEEKEFRNASKTRNYAISLAKGEYLCFLDADDYLLEGALENGLNAFNENIDIILFDRQKITEDGSEIIYETNNKPFFELHSKYKGTIHDIYGVQDVILCI